MLLGAFYLAVDQLLLFRDSLPSRPPEVRIIGTREACQRLVLAHLRHPVLSVAPWTVPGETVPQRRLSVVWATRREELPEDMRRELAELEGRGGLEEWKP